MERQEEVNDIDVFVPFVKVEFGDEEEDEQVMEFLECRYDEGLFDMVKQEEVMEEEEEMDIKPVFEGESNVGSSNLPLLRDDERYWAPAIQDEEDETDDDSSDFDWLLLNETKKPKKSQPKIKQKIKKVHANRKMKPKWKHPYPARNIVNKDGSLVLTSFKDIAESMFLQKNTSPQNLEDQTNQSEKVEASLEVFQQPAQCKEPKPKQKITKNKIATKAHSSGKITRSEGSRILAKRCLICGVCFKSALFLKQHLEPDIFCFKCSVCPNVFSDEEKCTSHISQYHKSGTMEPGIFTKTANKRRGKSSLIWFQCRSCKVIVKSEVGIVNHVKKTHQSLYEDTKTGMFMKDIFSRHESNKVRIPWSQEVRLKKLSVTLEELEKSPKKKLRNLQRSKSMKQNPAQQNEKAHRDFSVVPSIPIDVISHFVISSENQAQCDCCKETFSKRQLYLDHMEKGHDSLTCSLCDIQFSSKNDLTKHCRVHNKMEILAKGVVRENQDSSIIIQ